MEPRTVKTFVHVRKNKLNEVWCAKPLKDILIAMEWDLILKLNLANEDVCPLCLRKLENETMRDYLNWLKKI